MKITEGYLLFESLFGDIFLKSGFSATKTKGLFERSGGDVIDRFRIKISKNSSGDLWHHATLEFSELKINELFERVDKLMRSAEGLESVPTGLPTCTITDWKDLYRDLGESVEYTWFTSFSKLVEDANATRDYQSMVRIGVKWFDFIKDHDNLIAQLQRGGLTRQLKMYLTTMKCAHPEKLEASYGRLVEDIASYRSVNRAELQAFFKELNAN